MGEAARGGGKRSDKRRERGEGRAKTRRSKKEENQPVRWWVGQEECGRLGHYECGEESLRRSVLGLRTTHPGAVRHPSGARLCSGNNHRWTQMDTDSEAPIQHRAARNQAHRLVGDGRGLPHLCASVVLWTFRRSKGSLGRWGHRPSRGCLPGGGTDGHLNEPPALEGGCPHPPISFHCIVPAREGCAQGGVCGSKSPYAFQRASEVARVSRPV